MGRALRCTCMLHYRLLKVVINGDQKCWSFSRRFRAATTMFWEGSNRSEYSERTDRAPK